MSIKNKGVIYGDVELDESEFEARKVKVRVTTMIDEDVIVALKKIADSKGQKYQTLLNQVLRAFVGSKHKAKVAPIGEKRIRQIIREEIRKKA